MRPRNLFLPNLRSISAASAGVLPLSPWCGLTKLRMICLRLRNASAPLGVVNPPRITLMRSLIFPLYLSMWLLLYLNPATFALIGTPKVRFVTILNKADQAFL